MGQLAREAADSLGTAAVPEDAERPRSGLEVTWEPVDSGPVDAAPMVVLKSAQGGRTDPMPWPLAVKMHQRGEVNIKNLPGNPETTDPREPTDENRTFHGGTVDASAPAPAAAPAPRTPPATPTDVGPNPVDLSDVLGLGMNRVQVPLRDPADASVPASGPAAAPTPAPRPQVRVGTSAPAPDAADEIAQIAARSPTAGVPRMPRNPAMPGSMIPAELLAGSGGGIGGGTGGSGRSAPASSPAPHDYAADLAAARDQSDKLRLLANLDRAGETFTSAFAHKAPNYASSAGLDALAAEPEAEVRENMQLDQAQTAMRAQQAALDPNSPINRRAQEVFASVAPTVAKALGPRLQLMTRDDLAKLMGEEDKTQDRSLKRQEIEATEGLKQAQLKRQQDKDQEDAAYKKQELGLGYAKLKQGAEMAAEMRAQRQSDRQNQQDDKDAQALEKRLANEDPGTLEDLKTAAKYMGNLDNPDNKASIPGMGVIESHIPAALLGSDAQEMRQAADSLVTARAHSLFGSRVTETEINQLRKAYGLGPGATEHQFRLGVQRLQHDLSATAQKHEAGFRPEVVETVRNRGVGTSAQDLMNVPREAALRARIQQLRASGVTDPAAIKAQLRQEGF